MQRGTRSLIALAVAVGISSGSVLGQEKPVAIASETLASYDANRETTLVGTVKVFTAAAQTAPRGAHVTLETNSGPVDVHAGDARLLVANQFTIQNGDTLRIIGETVAYGKGTQFVARILQKGTQVLAVRSVRGIPMSYVAPREGGQGKAPGGVL